MWSSATLPITETCSWEFAFYAPWHANLWRGIFYNHTCIWVLEAVVCSDWFVAYHMCRLVCSDWLLAYHVCWCDVCTCVLRFTITCVVIVAKTETTDFLRSRFIFNRSMHLIVTMETKSDFWSCSHRSIFTEVLFKQCSQVYKHIIIIIINVKIIIIWSYSYCQI